LRDRLSYIIIIFFFVSCSNSETTTSVLHYSKNQQLSVEGIPENLDTIYITPYKEAIYTSEDYVIKVYQHHPEEWSLEYLRTNLCENGKNNRVSDVECLNMKENMKKGLRIFERGFYLPNEKIFVKSWIWNIGTCQYYLGIEKHNTEEEKIAHLNKQLSITDMEFDTEDNFNCADVNMVSIPLRFFNKYYFF